MLWFESCVYTRAGDDAINGDVDMTVLFFYNMVLSV